MITKEDKIEKLIERWQKGLTPEEQKIIWTKEKALKRALEFEKLNKELK